MVPNIYQKGDSVYLLQEIEAGKPTGLYKIGYTNGSTATRMKQYRAGNARTVVEYYTILVESGTGQPIEAKIHSQFFDQRLKNKSAGDEWFRLTPEQVQQVVRFMSQFDCDRNNKIPAIAWNINADPLETKPIGGADFRGLTFGTALNLMPNVPTDHILYHRKLEFQKAVYLRFFTFCGKYI